MRDVQGGVGASQGTPVSRIFHSEAFDTVACVAVAGFCVFFRSRFLNLKRFSRTKGELRTKNKTTRE